MELEENHQEMDVQGLSSDIISTLPQYITEKILSLLPIRDLMRTSILSRKWRYCWAGIPLLLLDDEGIFGHIKFEVSSFMERFMKRKLAPNVILQVLLLRTSPLIDFTLSIELELVSEMDLIILYLSRNNTLKRFKSDNRSYNYYKLPSSFFSLQGLEHVHLVNCEVEPPKTFSGFTRLRYMFLDNVEISTKTLKHFLTKCPLLEDFCLFGNQNNFTAGNKFTFVELFECLPSIVSFTISKYHMKYFATGGMPHKLPTQLVHLNALYLGVCLTAQHELSSILCLIKSSPNLKKIYVRLHHEHTSMDSVDPQNCASFKLNHLEILQVVFFSNLAIEREFVKIAMANSPLLKKVHIVLPDNISIDEELRVLKDLQSFPRASHATKIVIEREETLP